jgi:uncharacterized phage-associated protein
MACCFSGKKLYFRKLMRFLYNPKKAAQAAAYLVSLNGGQMDMFCLMKILYLSDRKALLVRGQTITGDVMVSMPHGPVLSHIYDDAKASPEIQSEAWREYFAGRDNNVIVLREAPSTDELSEFERGILRETNDNYRHYSPSQLRKLTHGLPEYTDPEGSSLKIDPTTILREDGWTTEEIEDAIMSAREGIFIARVADDLIHV